MSPLALARLFSANLADLLHGGRGLATVLSDSGSYASTPAKGANPCGALEMTVGFPSTPDLGTLMSTRLGIPSLLG